MGVSIKKTDTTTADFSTGTLTDVVAVNDGLELDYFYDDFTGNLSDWEQVLGTWDINTSDQLYNSASEGDAADICTVSGVSVADATIECEVNINSLGRQLVARVQDDGTTDPNFYMFRGYTVTSNLQIYKRYNGSWTLLNETSQTYANGDTINLRATISGNNLTLEDLTNNVSVTTTDSDISNAGKWGVGHNTTSTGGDKWNWIELRYNKTGNRISPTLDLSPVGTVESSQISWTETLNTQTITIETSVDGGSTWQIATNGGAVPNLPANPTTLDVRQVLDTTDTTVIPRLELLEVDINTAEENTDSGSFTATLEQGDFKVVQADSGSFSGAEGSSLAGFSFNDSGSFNIDAENWYTMVWEVFQEDSLTSKIDYNLEGWIQNPKATSQWQSVDENTQDLWTKVDKNKADWNKG